MERVPETSAPPTPAADAPAALVPGLYLVATPIGNLQDLSPRASAILGAADLVLCEDTRVTGGLLHALGLRVKMRSYHEHNAEAVRPDVLRRLDDGARIALVSDAGTPLVSDPGYKLVRAALDGGHQVIPVPGPSAVLAALTASGLPTDRFFFQGFLPAKPAARTRVIDEIAKLPATLIVFESAQRAEATLEALAQRLGERRAVLARELTKRFEDFRRATLAELADSCRLDPPRGEVVLVVAGAGEEPVVDDAAVDQALRAALSESGPSEAARRVANATGRPRRALYARALYLRG